MKIKITILTIVIILLVSCSTVKKEQNLDVVKNIILKNLEKESEKLDKIDITGLIKISGVKEIPSGFIKFNVYGSLKKGDLVLKLSFLNRDITEIVIANFDKILFMNHVGRQYMNFAFADMDFSKFIGINVNLIECCYFFLGRIPFSKTIELMDIKYEMGEYILEISDEASQYTININSDYNITKAKINSQYFGTTSIDSITYIKNSDGAFSTKTVNCSSGTGAKLSLIIDNINYNNTKAINIENIPNYQKIENMKDLILKF